MLKTTIAENRALLKLESDIQYAEIQIKMVSNDTSRRLTISKCQNQ